MAFRNGEHTASEGPKAPTEQGTRLATFPRGDGVEMRINLAEYNGHPYLALRVWERDQSGQWWPCKGKGVSIRMSETGPLGDVLSDIAGGEIRPEPTGKGPAKNRQSRQPYSQAVRPSSVPFDETEGDGEHDA